MLHSFPTLSATLNAGNITGAHDIVMSNGQALKTGQVQDDLFILQAYDQGLISYKTYITLKSTEDGSSCDLSPSVTMNGLPIVYGTEPTIYNLNLSNTGALRTGQSSGNTLYLQAYDVDGGAFTTFGTLTAGNTPTFELSTSVTCGGKPLPTSGTYTPTYTNVTNISSFGTVSDLNWVRVADRVFVFGRVSLDTGVSGAFECRLTLPIASNFSLFTDAGGSCISTTSISAAVRADTTNDQLTIIGTTTDTAARDYAINASYRII